MADDDLHDQISSLEAHIDELTGVIESCRKLILVSKVAIAAGGIWLLVFTFGAIRFDSVAMIWPAPGSEDTELGVLMELEVGHGETEVYPRVQA
jgi:hypothetical protein